VVCRQAEYENYGLRSHLTPRRIAVISGRPELTKRAVDSASALTARKMEQYFRRLLLSEKRFTAILRKRGSQRQRLKTGSRESGAESESALAFAMAGENTRAESLAEPKQALPLDTRCSRFGCLRFEHNWR